MPTPLLPVLVDEDSMLSQKFGRETANYFSGSPLNRLSFLRTDHDFLRAAFAHPSAAVLLMNSLSPLVQPDASQLAIATADDVLHLTGPDPFGKKEDELIGDFNSEDTQTVVLFLGIDEKGELPSHNDVQDTFAYKNFRGTPYFAIDVTPRGTLADAANALITAVLEKGFSFHDASPRAMGLEAGQAATYGQARALLDWNARNPFCAQCGQRTLSVNAGTKRVCPPTDKATGAAVDRLPCATRGTVSNLSFPRTDPTVIMAIISADGSKVLLGRQRRWPKFWYSTLAGFQEPGESIEEAVRREVWEESGVRVGRVVLHSSQPWPFPASLMIGAVGQALSGDGETIFLGHDAELEDARWVPLEEAREALAKGVSNLGEPAPEGYAKGKLRLPPPLAIANRLITSVVEGWWVPPKI
ncbi:NUDIX hydrolase domain-like protein [Lasiosphaeria miniovina]|uniref:NAD(+) diphosphatase n=1 Tax=Lasiosphaeria miniovina TaxID=1954250 RepID=A0AA40A4J2_9PEZI|nr:NUDIX hydrolase domain-like protein [Lasiosphaeria miniovina]KAK0709149.1 NUDIX hydrolase domain-like protein [Lasiosphaeria miniovina]